MVVASLIGSVTGWALEATIGASDDDIKHIVKLFVFLQSITAELLTMQNLSPVSKTMCVDI
jgi:hypothetical protein